MAYGDADHQYGYTPWEDFETTEYLWRLRDLIEEHGRASALSCHPEDPRAYRAGLQERRLGLDIEETALEFVSYMHELRQGRPLDVAGKLPSGPSGRRAANAPTVRIGGETT